MAALIFAIRFLTIIPVPGWEAQGRDALARAAWWFPVVGLALGGALAIAARVLEAVFPPILSAVLLIALWKVATGGIHLDGLADCLDGLGGRDHASRLAIMGDSRIGVFGVVGLILLFLISIAALAEMPWPLRWRALLLAPAIGRVAPLLVGARFRAATPDHGLGASFGLALSRWAGPVHLLWIPVVAARLLGPWGLAIVLAALAAVFLWSAFLARRVGGLTGDVLGAGVELGEIGVLLGAAAAGQLRLF